MKAKLAKEIRLARRLWPFLRHHRGELAGIVSLGILASLAEGIGIGLFIPLLQTIGNLPHSGGSRLAELFQGVIQPIPSDQRQTVILIGIVAAIAAKAGLTFSYGALTQRLYSRVSHQLRSAAHEQLLKVSYPFILRSRVGALHYTLATATWQAGDAVGLLLNLLVTFSTTAVYLLLLLLISWKLTIGVAIALFLISRIGAIFIRRAAVLGRLLRRTNLGLAHRMFQMLQGLKVIQTFARKDYEQARFDDVSTRVSRVLFHLGLTKAAVSPIYELLVAMLLVGLLAFGVRNPEIMPSLIVFILLLYRLQPKIRQIDSYRIELSGSAAAIEDLNSLLDPRGKPFPKSGRLPFDRLDDGISFEGVAFQYEGTGASALKGISTHIPARKTTALVGRSGSGKSTLINLIIRLLEPTRGKITVDGTDLMEIDLVAWRSGIAVVSQDVYMFDASVRDNIAYGNLDASEDEIMAAAKLAHADEFIRDLPHGFETVVGERGARLSGGQQQRLALARAIVRNPQILILDEATNALDSISEKFVQEALAQLSRDRTVIVIAHRLSTIEGADKVIVLSDGMIVEQGAPRELLQNESFFGELHRTQFHRAIRELPG